MAKNENQPLPSSKRKIAVKDIAFNAVMAAIYCACTLLLQPISFGAIQFRIAEILVLLCFWRKDLIIGLTCGCLISNVFSFSYWDVLIGTMATLISLLFIVYLSPRLCVALIWPVLFNGLAVGAELTWIYPAFPEYWQNALSVAGGELAVMAIGYVFWVIVIHNANFRKMLSPNIHPATFY